MSVIIDEIIGVTQYPTKIKGEDYLKAAFWEAINNENGKLLAKYNDFLLELYNQGLHFNEIKLSKI